MHDYCRRGKFERLSRSAKQQPMPPWCVEEGRGRPSQDGARNSATRRPTWFAWRRCASANLRQEKRQKSCAVPQDSCLQTPRQQPL